MLMSFGSVDQPDHWMVDNVWTHMSYGISFQGGQTYNYDLLLL